MPAHSVRPHAELEIGSAGETPTRRHETTIERHFCGALAVAPTKGCSPLLGCGPPLQIAAGCDRRYGEDKLEQQGREQVNPLTQADPRQIVEARELGTT